MVDHFPCKVPIMFTKHALRLAVASMAVTAATAVAAEDSWTGPYIGIKAGYSAPRGDKGEIVLFDTNLDGNFNDTVRNVAGDNVFSPGFCSGAAPTPVPTDLCKRDSDNFEGGVQIGYDWHLKGDFVVGVVGAYTRTNMTDSVTAYTTTPANYIFTRNLRNLYSARARGGKIVDTILIYGTAGINYGDIRNSFRSSNTANEFIGRGDNGSIGFEVGGGLERKIGKKASIGLQYLYRELTDDDFIVRAAPGTTGPTHPFRLVNPQGTDFKRSVSRFESHAIELAVNYRF